jgi:hypothetical protein
MADEMSSARRGDDAIWDERGTLTRAHDESEGAELPPLSDDVGPPRPLREILQPFVAASPAERERYSLLLENGQAFSADDISQLLDRPDSPFS